MKKILKDTFALFLITLIAGALLGLVYQVTKGPIQAQNEKKALNAYRALFVDMNEPEDVTITEDLAAKIADAISADGANCGVSKINGIVKAKDASGNVLGYIFNVTNKEGYGGDIVFTVGVDMSGTITGLEILNISETAGLGAKAETPAFRSQFVGIKADTVAYSKTGKSADNEIDAITSATYTTKSVVHGVNSCLAAYRVVTGGGANE